MKINDGAWETKSGAVASFSGSPPFKLGDTGLNDTIKVGVVAVTTGYQD